MASLSDKVPNEFKPICPHCDHQIDGLKWITDPNSGVTVFFCPSCCRVLGCQLMDHTLAAFSNSKDKKEFSDRFV